MCRILFLALVLTLGGCGGEPRTPWVVSRLYFGLSSSAGPVTQEQFSAFLDQEITPQFPAGLTRFHAVGQWRGKDGVLQHEPSEVVEIVHLDSPESAARLAAIIYLYKKNFHQESVLMIQGRPQVRF